MPLAGCAGTNGLRQNVNREKKNLGGGKDVKSSGWRPLLPRNSEKLLTVRLCEDSRVMRAMLHFYIFILTRSIFFSLQFLLGISVPFTSVTASSKRHLCFVQTWCETPLFRYMRKKSCLHFVPFLKTKMGIDEKKNFYTMLWWRHQHRQRKGGAHLTLKGTNGQARNWPVMIVMDARVCWPLARCISENDWGFGGL